MTVLTKKLMEHDVERVMYGSVCALGTATGCCLVEKKEKKNNKTSKQNLMKKKTSLAFLSEAVAREII